jgi:hypothetical protein
VVLSVQGDGGARVLGGSADPGGVAKCQCLVEPLAHRGELEADLDLVGQAVGFHPVQQLKVGVHGRFRTGHIFDALAQMVQGHGETIGDQRSGCG